MSAPMDTSPSSLPNLHASWESGSNFSSWQARTNSAVTSFTRSFVTLGIHLLAAYDAVWRGNPVLPGMPTDASDRTARWEASVGSALNGLDPSFTVAGNAGNVQPASDAELTTATGMLTSWPDTLHTLRHFVTGAGATLAWKFLPRSHAVLLFTWLQFILTMNGSEVQREAGGAALRTLLPAHFADLEKASTAAQKTFPPYDYGWQHAPLYLRVVEHLAALLADLIEPLESARLQFSDMLTWHGLAALRLVTTHLPTGNSASAPLHVARIAWLNTTTPSSGWETLPEQRARQQPPTSSRSQPSASRQRKAKRPRTSSARLREPDFPESLRMLALYRIVLGNRAPSNQQALDERWAASKDKCSLCDTGPRHRLLDCSTVKALPPARLAEVRRILDEREAFKRNK